MGWAWLVQMPEVAHSAGRLLALESDPGRVWRGRRERVRSMNIKRASSTPPNTIFVHTWVQVTVQRGHQGFAVFAFSSLPTFTVYGTMGGRGCGCSILFLPARCSTFPTFVHSPPGCCQSLNPLVKRRNQRSWLGRFDLSTDRSNREIREYPTHTPCVVLSSPLLSFSFVRSSLPSPVASPARCTLNAPLLSPPTPSHSDAADVQCSHRSSQVLPFSLLLLLFSS